MSTARQRKRFEIVPLEHDPRFQRQRFYWRLKAANGRTILHSPRNYDSVVQTRRAVKSIRRMISLAAVIVLDSNGKVCG